MRFIAMSMLILSVFGFAVNPAITQEASPVDDPGRSKINVGNKGGPPAADAYSLDTSRGKINTKNKGGPPEPESYEQTGTTGSTNWTTTGAATGTAVTGTAEEGNVVDVDVDMDSDADLATDSDTTGGTYEEDDEGALPNTASSLPLLGAIGLLALLTVLGLRLLRVSRSSGD